MQGRGCNGGRGSWSAESELGGLLGSGRFSSHGKTPPPVRRGVPISELIATRVRESESRGAEAGLDSGVGDQF
ncbi:hypothetical protein MGG_17322 [Pyricularia oryzae 70-15]|uniref:Uncharacterized protein n=1 Tax=Pyricularia oryzae (strain 70-15 / ATCC MYA-4617 / FGSC 8958) TaxID=242507 RepID=G4NCL0_PYRO7|nr:uncharacterized protein MGG_17322 [Pyricularia oryzae 70-15]EHA48307.1 hypothetical protein MGG_17322 [Pyricularia oryzae 70-15]